MIVNILSHSRVLMILENKHVNVEYFLQVIHDNIFHFG